MDLKSLRNIAAISALAFALGGCISAKQMTAPAVVDGDDDGDGVLNSLDECPNTPAGAQVDSRGCEIHAALDATHFAFDSAELTSEAQTYLAGIAAMLSGKSLTAHGHTDSIGSDSYNMGLSERRAQSVADYLGTEGVSGMNIVGHGESDPVASNDTEEGRAMNRRVDITTASQ